MKKNNKFSRKLGAGLVALTAFGAMGLGAGVASAAEVTEDEGNLILQKFLDPEVATPVAGNGMQLPSSTTSGWTPMNDIKFQVQQVEGINVKTNAGWKAYNTLVNDWQDYTGDDTLAEFVMSKGYTLGTADEATTAGTGTITWSNKDVGVYLVTEESGQTWTDPDTDKEYSVQASMPFLVSIPLTDVEDKDAWNYNVYVYPKNQISSAEKTVSDGDAYTRGDTFTYSVSGAVPAGTLSKYVVTDTLASELTYESTRVYIDNGNSTTTALAETTDYTLVDATNANTVTLNSTGLGKLQAARDVNNGGNANARLVVEYTVRANADGVISNTATINVNDVETDTNEVETKWGSHKFLKVDAGDNTKTLEGAEFEVWGSDTNDVSTAKRLTGFACGASSAVNASGSAATASDDSWRCVTAADGTMTVSGLRYTNFANDTDLSSGTDMNYYWLKEVKAPEGYELLPEMIAFTVTADSSATTATATTVENVPSNGSSNIGTTGLGGKLAVGGLIGLSLAGLGAYLMSKQTRREDLGA